MVSEVENLSVVDPGFGGGTEPLGAGVLTSDMGTFWQKHMQKQKNWNPLGGGAHAGSAPLGSANAYAALFGHTLGPA